MYGRATAGSLRVPEQLLTDEDAGDEEADEGQEWQEAEQDANAERRSHDRHHGHDGQHRDHDRAEQTGSKDLQGFGCDHPFGQANLAGADGRQEQARDQGGQEHPEGEQEGRRPEERAQRDQLGVEALDVAGDLHARGLGHGRLDGADVAGDRGSVFEGERAADDHNRLDRRAVECRVPLDHRQRVDGSGDVRIAIRHEDDISLLAGRQRDVATEGHQDTSGVGERFVRSHRDGRGERGDNQDGPE